MCKSKKWPFTHRLDVKVNIFEEALIFNDINGIITETLIKEIIWNFKFWFENFKGRFKTNKKSSAFMKIPF